MNEKTYFIPQKKSFSLFGIGVSETCPIDQIMMTVDDVDRAYFLSHGGYLPCWLANWHRDKSRELVDWALSQRLGPSYWQGCSEEDYREAIPSERHPTATLLFKGFCDRDRIDMILLERRKTEENL